MPQPAQEGVREELIAQEPAPARVVEIRSYDCGELAISFFHQLEKDVGLLGLQVQKSQLVD